MLTPGKKKYLFTIYEISLQKEAVRNVDVANAINISKASVCNMLRTLEEDGMVTIVQGKKVALSSIGGEYAKNLYNVYKLLYCFLIRTFKSSKTSAREDAIACVCNLSDENTENMKNYFSTCIKRAGK